MTSFKQRKQLAECLILSRLKYCNVIFDPLTVSQYKRLQKVQNSTASFVFGRYSNTSDVTKLGWLPVRESTEYSLLKMCHKSIYTEQCPEYIKLKTEQRNTRSCRDNGPDVIQNYYETPYAYRVATLFNGLPKNIKCLTNEDKFSLAIKSYLGDQALARNL